MDKCASNATNSDTTMTDKIAESIDSIYTSDIIEDAALVLNFMWYYSRINGIQSVFLVQKELSLAVRLANDIESPYIN